MAKQITHLSVFLASPSDLSEERVAVKHVVDDLNMLLRQAMNVHLDLLTWETDAYPSAGIDAQDVINQQIGDEYDIFIGMMWQRFGTPTGRAGSGTEEEFERAYKRFLDDNGQTKIMIYFSAKPIKPDEIDIEQLGKVRDFKSRAQSLGILHWSFNDVESFQKVLKVHLMKQISDIIDASKYNPDANINKNDTPVITDDANNAGIEKIDDFEDENGYFDLMEVFSENFSEVEKILTKMGDDIEELGNQMKRKGAKIEAVTKSPNRPAHSYRILIDSSAADITNYVNLTKVELPRFHELFATGIDAFSNSLTVSETSGGKMDEEQLESLLESIYSAKSNIDSAGSSIAEFKESVDSIPGVTKSMNRATRLLRNTLSSVIDEFNNAVGLLDELSLVVYSILQKYKDGDSEAAEI